MLDDQTDLYWMECDGIIKRKKVTCDSETRNFTGLDEAIESFAETEIDLFNPVQDFIHY